MNTGERDPRDTMSLRPGEPVAVTMPSPAAWRRHVALLARRAEASRDPLAAARLHQQRAAVLAELGEPDAALAASRDALDAHPGYLPALLDLRAHALAAADQPLAARLTDVDLQALAAREGTDPRDTAEIGAFFGLVWLFRWPDPARAAAALACVEAAGDPLGLADRLLPLCLPDDARAERDRRRLAHDRAPPVLAELGRHLTREPATADEGHALIAEAAAADPVAAWYRVEDALAARDPRALAHALEALAALCPGVGQPMLRFLAGELWELVAQEPAEAARLYAQVDGGALRAVIAAKQIIADVRQFLRDPLGMAATLVEQAEQLGDARLEAVLYLRAAQVADAAGERERARAAARQALDRWPEDERARHLLERIAWQGRQWPTLRALLAEDARPDLARLVRAAILEHALDQPAGALGALGGADASRPELATLRTRQRLAMHMVGGEATAEEEARVRAWQQEANLLDPGDRRADLYLRIGRFYLARTPQLEKALTYLFWVLDEDPDHLTALRVIEHAARSTGRTRPLVEALERLLALLDRPAERFPLRRELTELREEAGAPPEVLIALHRGALADEPTDIDAFVALEALYTQTGRAGDLQALYEDRLRVAEGPEARAELAVRFGPFLVDQGDAIAALRLYDRVMPDTPPGPLRSRLEMLVTDAAAAGGLSGSLPALDTNELEALDRDGVDFDFAEDDIDELLTVVQDPLAQPSLPPGPAPPPLPPLAPMPPLVTDTGRRSLPGLAATATGGERAEGASADDDADDDDADDDDPSSKGSVDDGSVDDGSVDDGPADDAPVPLRTRFGARAAVEARTITATDEIEIEVDADDEDLSGSVELSPADLIDAELDEPAAAPKRRPPPPRQRPRRRRSTASAPPAAAGPPAAPGHARRRPPRRRRARRPRPPPASPPRHLPSRHLPSRRASGHPPPALAARRRPHRRRAASRRAAAGRRRPTLLPRLCRPAPPRRPEPRAAARRAALPSPPRASLPRPPPPPHPRPPPRPSAPPRSPTARAASSAKSAPATPTATPAAPSSPRSSSAAAATKPPSSSTTTATPSSPTPPTASPPAPTSTTSSPPPPPSPAATKPSATPPTPSAPGAPCSATAPATPRRSPASKRSTATPATGAASSTSSPARRPAPATAAAARGCSSRSPASNGARCTTPARPSATSSKPSTSAPSTARPSPSSPRPCAPSAAGAPTSTRSPAAASTTPPT
ncbi:MAG: hypothetical protein H6705_00670 [Myxococcales bacterium]|nr:hypothetical protein [Myxococcales bacterium]